MPPGVIVVFGLFIVLMVAMAIYGHAAEKKRREALMDWARSKGMYFHQKKVYGFDDQHPELKFLRQGSNRYAYNITSGKWGDHEATAFDYHYETSSRDSKGNRQTRHYHFSVLLLQPDFPLQRLLIRKEGVFDKLKSTFGFKDINFESAEFSKKFFVAAEDRKFAYDVIHPRAMELLMRNTAWTIECDHEVLAIFKANEKLDPRQFEYANHLATELLEGIPDHVKDNTRLKSEGAGW